MFPTHLLGTDPDSTLSSLYSVKASAIAHKRGLLGISKFSEGLTYTYMGKTVPDMMSLLQKSRSMLGRSTDVFLAKHLGVRQDLVTIVREMLEIPSYLKTICRIKLFLGKQLDLDLAEKFGWTVRQVRDLRVSLGVEMDIPEHKNQKPELDKVFDLLGVKSDREVAEITGISRFVVRKYRISYGIPKYSKCNVVLKDHAHLLGKMSDNRIAKQFGLSRQSVGDYRNRLGIAKWVQCPSRVSDK